MIMDGFMHLRRVGILKRKERRPEFKRTIPPSPLLLCSSAGPHGRWREPPNLEK